MSLRFKLRLVAYTLLGVLLMLLLGVYLLYLSMQRKPEFYKRNLEVAVDVQEGRNKEMLRKVRNLSNDIQEVDKPWTGTFSGDDVNGYFAVEVAKEGSNLLPKEIKDPRVNFKNRELEFACRIEQGSIKGILNMTLGISVPEPNYLTLRLKKVNLGKVPITRDQPKQMLVDALKAKGYEVKEGTEDGDPTLTIPLKLKYDDKKEIDLESIELFDGGLRLSGATFKPEKKP